MSFDVFLSHQGDDKDEIKQLAAYLEPILPAGMRRETFLIAPIMVLTLLAKKKSDTKIRTTLSKIIILIKVKDNECYSTTEIELFTVVI